jgi:hypothetical protein
VRKVSEFSDTRSWVIYGRSGSGKTTLAATFPKPILYLNVRDNGTDSISNVEDIFVMDIHEFADFEHVYWWLKENPDRYATVVVDTVSQLQTMLVEEEGRKKNRSKARSAGDWGTLSRRDWGDLAGVLKAQLNDYRDLTQLDIEVVFIAQDRTFNLSDEEEENPEMLAPEVGPALMPSVARALNASVSVVGNTFIRERIIKKPKQKATKRIEYCFGIGPSSLYARKVRKPKERIIPDLVIDPQYEDIVDVINEGESE